MATNGSEERTSGRFTRRQFLRASAAGGFGALILAACGTTGGTSGTAATAPPAAGS